MSCVVYGTIQDTHAALMTDYDLQDTLYPRTTESNLDTKLSFNMFCFNGVHVIGDEISKFNHSCNPDSFLTAADHVNDDRVYGVWILGNIKAWCVITVRGVQLRHMGPVPTKWTLSQFRV